MHVRALAVLLGASVLAGCASSGLRVAHPTSSGPDQVHWLSGPTDQVRTLLLPPAPAARLESASGAWTGLSLGAFYSRWTSERGVLEQLSLLLQFEGGDPREMLSLSRALLLEIDGALVFGAPGVTGNSYRLDTSEAGRRRLTLAIPVDVADLERLAVAHRVRARIGEWDTFQLPTAVRTRFRKLVDGLPKECSVGPGLRTLDQLASWRIS